MDPSPSINPWLAGNFAPVRSEDDFVLEVEGEIPPGLRGAFYRNGPNPQFEPRGQHHWFAGDGMIHAFFVDGGRVAYRNRYVRTPKWLLENAAGRALFGGFDPRAADPSVVGKDNGVANTNVVWHAGRLLALEEAHMPFELDPGTLEPRGYVESYRGRVTAHPKIDPETGEMLWFAYSAGGWFTKTMSWGVTDASGRVTRRDDFEAPFSSMAHDFLATRRHALFPVLPLTGDLGRAMRGGPPFAWEPDKGAHVGVMARDAGVGGMRWFTTEACYVFHPMNAWEEGETIVADVMEYPVAPLFPRPDGSTPDRTPARLVRWTFDLAANSDTIRREPLDDLPGEFPRFDERRAGLSYRHGWFAGQSDLPRGEGFDCIAHVDLATGRRTLYPFAAGDSPGEPVFVPRAPDAAEGDGWIVALVYRGAEDRSDFVVFDAGAIEAGPIARARAPRRVPFGFHGNWRPA
ncbi:carotenoid cleavage dioxygenase [Roseiarcus fermentans]|uniref:Dioxygenase n=1 Tax=Roseiarcus fermentans TaxID=1473586 RepID=A0A366FVY5_9HYPH|nr:carotenoid oxygenase family protein [Roseiarcus fermentans]RBP18306.1 carotenoid cleavage dioxygenase [Roseiarcus fermentans]